MPSFRPNRISSTSRSRSLRKPKTLRICSRSNSLEAASTGSTTLSSLMKSPNSVASSLLPTGVSNDMGSIEIRRMSRILLTACRHLRLSMGSITRSFLMDSLILSDSSGVKKSSSRASSSTDGSCPSCCTSSRCFLTILLMVSNMWTGMRIVRAWSAIARLTAWRIHQVA